MAPACWLNVWTAGMTGTTEGFSDDETLVGQDFYYFISKFSVLVFDLS